MIASSKGVFRRGFHTVMGTDALQILRPEDLELLICGNPVLDFGALQNATTYEGGYSKTSNTIRYTIKIFLYTSNA